VGASNISAAHVEIGRPQSLSLQEKNDHEFALHGRKPPRTGALVLSPSPRASWVNPFDSILRLGSQSGHSRSARDPPGWAMPPPSEGNATARRGYERRPPIACKLPPGACTLAHAFANHPPRTQRTSLKHPMLNLYNSIACPVGGLRHREKQRKCPAARASKR
jgi:hypothetical protein